VLLDTCAVIWLANGEPMAAPALSAITAAALADGVFVSPISAWEIGLLSRTDRGRGLVFLPDPQTWVARFMAGPSIRLAALSPQIAVSASHLPQSLHGDPADRLLIATARDRDLPIVTRDSRIIAYGQTGQVSVIPC
jgi:PIN domain nuclease of toxin-antitoxin system